MSVHQSPYHSERNAPHVILSATPPSCHSERSAPTCHSERSGAESKNLKCLSTISDHSERNAPVMSFVILGGAESSLPINVMSSKNQPYHSERNAPIDVILERNAPVMSF